MNSIFYPGGALTLLAIPPVRVTPDARHLAEGQGVRFDVALDGVSRPAFAVRFRGGVHGYLNQCRHEARPLDFGDARFLDESYDALVCCHHGARYHPETGACLDGPCEGRPLTRLVFEERDGALWCTGVVRGSET